MPRSHKKLARKNRRIPSPSVFSGPPDVVISGAGASTPTTSFAMTFAGAMMVSGVAPLMTVGSLTLGAFTQVSPTVVKVATNAAATLTGQTLTVGNREPSLRSPAGGYPVAKTITF